MFKIFVHAIHVTRVATKDIFNKKHVHAIKNIEYWNIEILNIERRKN